MFWLSWLKRLSWWLAVVSLLLILFISLGSKAFNFVLPLRLRSQADTTIVEYPTITDKTTLGQLPTALASPVTTVPANTIPKPLPTNNWWSSGLLENWPSPLFAWPLAVTLTNEGININAPQTQSIPRASIAVATDTLRLFAPGKVLKNSQLRPGYGDWDVTFRLLDFHDKPVLDISLAEGSPFTFITSHTKTNSIQLPPNSSVESLTCQKPCGAAMVIHAPHTTYLVVVPKEASLQQTNTILQINFSHRTTTMTVAVIAPDSQPADYLPYALNNPFPTEASFKLKADHISTTFTFSAPTLFTVWPHQAPYLTSTLPNRLGTYLTLRGPLHLYAGQKFTTNLPRPATWPGLPPEPTILQDPAFKKQLSLDIHNLLPPADNSYGASKDLFRLSHLAAAAQLTGDQELAQPAQQALRDTLVDWCTASPDEQKNFFAYDGVNGGLIAITPAYGSEKYNDHHFHYGYFIQAAATLAQLDPTFVTDYGQCIELLIRDIASIQPHDRSFPRLRYFDVFSGHSWANGWQPLADGNNQESTSEAINAWYSLALWGKVTKNQAIADTGLWLMSQEIASARTYWLNLPPAERSLPADFPYPLASIVWGGKIDYQTFFDSSPAATHGIQFFPASVGLLPLLDQPAITQLVDPVITTARPSIWRTHLKLIAAIFNPPLQKTLANEPHDPLYSQSYINQWLSTFSTLGQPDTNFTSAESCALVFQKDEQKTVIRYRFPADPATCSLHDQATQTTITLDHQEYGWNIHPLPLNYKKSR